MPNEDKPIDKGGRPCRYETHVEPYLDDIYEWLKQGYTDYSIAEQLGIARQTLAKYKETHDNLITVYARARTERNCLVMNRMFSKACGETVVAVKQKLDKQGNIVDLKEEQYIPPDVNAADLFLRNNDDSYKSAKADTGVTLIQNNYQLPELRKEIEKIESELKLLETGE